MMVPVPTSPIGLFSLIMLRTGPIAVSTGLLAIGARFGVVGSIEPLFVTISVASTVIYGVLLMFLAGRLYRREALLG